MPVLASEGSLPRMAWAAAPGTVYYFQIHLRPLGAEVVYCELAEWGEGPTACLQASAECGAQAGGSARPLCLQMGLGARHSFAPSAVSPCTPCPEATGS